MKTPMLDDRKLDIAWNGGARTDWNRLLVRAGPSSLEQSCDFGEALRRGLDGKWRNMLRASERDDVEVTRATGPGLELDWLLERYGRLRRERRFPGPSQDLVRAFAATDGAGANVLVLRAHVGDAPVAGALFLRHGASATYDASWTGADGRRTRAHNALLWHAMLTLKHAGVAWLDLGGIDASAPGVARFKLGVGGDVFTLAGTFI